MNTILTRHLRRRIAPSLKRSLDVSLSAILLILLSPLLALIAFMVRVRLGLPVLFRQKRPRFQGRPFTLYKFRTMSDERGAEEELLPDEQRLPRLGLFLRSTSLDELPELWNVLKGDMSLVGPRPLLMRYLDRYTPHQARRHEVKPGITGWAQVNGRNAITWERKFELDVWYVDHWSLLLDLRILCMTVEALVRRVGISRPGYATMPEFLGRGEDPSNSAGLA